LLKNGGKRKVTKFQWIEEQKHGKTCIRSGTLMPLKILGDKNG